MMRRALFAAIALALSLMCAALGVAASTAPMAGMTDSSVNTLMAGIGEATAAVATAPAVAGAAVAVAADAGSAMAGMCDSACVSEVTEMCSVAGLIVMTLMALLLATRRDTFLGLLARIRTSTRAVRLRREPTPWTVLSLSSLCVLRL